MVQRSRYLSPTIRWTVFASLLLRISVSAQAQTTSFPADFQSWNELEVSANFRPDFDVRWISQVRLSTHYPNPTAYRTGIEASFDLGRHFVVAPSYHYIGLENTAGRSGHFHVPMVSATVKQSWGRWSVSDRSRFLGALGGPTSFWIYLNRPRVDYRLGGQRQGLSVFAWDEIFYFSLFHDWSRNRIGSGVRKAIGERWAADIYYLRQDDGRLQPKQINGLGVTLELRLR